MPEVVSSYRVVSKSEKPTHNVFGIVWGCRVHREPQAAYALCSTLLLSRKCPKEIPRDAWKSVNGIIHRSSVYRKGCFR